MGGVIRMARSGVASENLDTIVMNSLRTGSILKEIDDPASSDPVRKFVTHAMIKTSDSGRTELRASSRRASFPHGTS